MGLTRKEQHNRKRAGRIEARGIRADNLAESEARFLGVDDGGAKCDLCDTAIKYLFGLTLIGSDGTRATFDSVGSQCITDWAEALPISKAQEALLAQIKSAQADAEKLKAQFRRRNHILKRLNSKESETIQQYWSAPEAVRKDEALKDIAEKVERYESFASDKQFGFFRSRLRERLGQGERRPQQLSEEDAALIERARETFRNGAAKLLGAEDRNTLTDIGKRAARFKGFKSARQRGLFAVLVKRAEEARASRPQQGELFPAEQQSRPRPSRAKAPCDREHPDYYNDLPL